MRVEEEHHAKVCLFRYHYEQVGSGRTSVVSSTKSFPLFFVGVLLLLLLLLLLQLLLLLLKWIKNFFSENCLSQNWQDTVVLLLIIKWRYINIKQFFLILATTRDVFSYLFGILNLIKSAIFNFTLQLVVQPNNHLWIATNSGNHFWTWLYIFLQTTTKWLQRPLSYDSEGSFFAHIWLHYQVCLAWNVLVVSSVPLHLVLILYIDEQKGFSKTKVFKSDLLYNIYDTRSILPRPGVNIIINEEPSIF